MDRTQRQKECLKRWIKANGKATVVACTGFGVLWPGRCKKSIK